MNYTKLAIEKAIEGGWKLESGYIDHHRPDAVNEVDVENEKFHNGGIEVGLSRIFLDPKFWQALGGLDYGLLIIRGDGIRVFDDEKFVEKWQGSWHTFIDHLIAEQPVETFFQQLLENK